MYLNKRVMLYNIAGTRVYWVNNPCAMQETRVRSLGQEDPLEKGMATYTSILAWRIPWTEEPGELSPWGRKELDTTKRLTLSFPGYILTT